MLLLLTVAGQVSASDGHVIAFGSPVTPTLSDSTTVLSGIGQAAGAKLEASPPLVTFNGIAVGELASAGATFRNVGSTPLTIDAVHLPSAPFTAEGAPAPGSTIEPGASVTITVTFHPTEAGHFSGEIELETSGGNETIGISGSAGAPSALEITNKPLEYGQVTVGSSESNSFTITNTSDTAVEVTKSKPPIGGAFAAATSLLEGTTIAPLRVRDPPQPHQDPPHRARRRHHTRPWQTHHSAHPPPTRGTLMVLPSINGIDRPGRPSRGLGRGQRSPRFYQPSPRT
jgi:hypothetical protein